MVCRHHRLQQLLWQSHWASALRQCIDSGVRQPKLQVTKKTGCLGGQQGTLQQILRNLPSACWIQLQVAGRAGRKFKGACLGPCRCQKTHAKTTFITKTLKGHVFRSSVIPAIPPLTKVSMPQCGTAVKSAQIPHAWRTAGMGCLGCLIWGVL